MAYRPGAVRDHTLRLMDDLFEALELRTAPVVGHSLDGMFALWYAAARPGRIASRVTATATRGLSPRSCTQLTASAGPAQTA